MICAEKGRTKRGLRWLLGTLVLLLILGFLPSRSDAALIIFFKDGRTLQAESTQIIGNRIRITTPTEILEPPSSAVFSIHEVSPPTASPNGPPPADVYRDITQQMTDKVRGEIQGQMGGHRGK
jgi:hypothetical protein